MRFSSNQRATNFDESPEVDGAVFGAEIALVPQRVVNVARKQLHRVHPVLGFDVPVVGGQFQDPGDVYACTGLRLRLFNRGVQKTAHHRFFGTTLRQMNEILQCSYSRLY